MRYRLLGETGIEVSELCFGTMSFGGDADAETSAAMYHRCRDAGINFFDCSNNYPKTPFAGRSEEILGSIIKGDRDQIVLTTKVFAHVGPGRNDRRLSRRHITTAVENSLKRLQTDRIDVYFMHHFDENTPIEESLRAFEDLVRAGKILYPGVSNWAAWQIATGIGICERHSWSRIAVIEPMYSLAKRQAEVEILPLARARNLGVITYSPVAGGLLSGKYGRRSTPQRGRLVENSLYSKRYGDAFYVDLAERYSSVCESRNVHPVTVAVAWVMANESVTAPIIGARNLDQLEASLAASDFEIDEALFAELSSLSPTPPPAHDRSETIRQR